MLKILKKLFCTGIILLVILFLVLFLFRLKYNKEIRSLAHTQVINATSDLINDSIDKQIENGAVQYGRIVYFEKDLEGRITALKTNMSEVNRLKTGILNLINDEILALDSSDLGIPLGNLLVPELFSGKGAIVPVKIISIRNSDASFSSKFTQAGINQTLHQITMQVLVDISVLVWGKTESFTVNSQVIIAETVIVGNVPDTFLQTGGNNGSERENWVADFYTQ